MIRGIVTGFGILILTIFLFLAIFAYCLVKFTEFDNLASLLSKIFVGNVIPQEKLNETYNTLLTECEEKESLEFSIGNKTVTLKCEDIKKSSPQELMTLLGKPLLYEVYYKKYDCDFIECLKQPGEEKFLVLLSSKANEFFKTIQTIFWVCAGIGLILILVSVKGHENKLKTLGITLLSIGIPILILIFVKDYFISIPTELETISAVIFELLFISFLIVTIIGVILTILGCILKLKPLKKRKKK